MIIIKSHWIIFKVINGKVSNRALLFEGGGNASIVGASLASKFKTYENIPNFYKNNSEYFCSKEREEVFI